MHNLHHKYGHHAQNYDIPLWAKNSPIEKNNKTKRMEFWCVNKSLNCIALCSTTINSVSR